MCTHSALIRCDNSSKCMLHGLPSYHTLAMPTCGQIDAVGLSHNTPDRENNSCGSPTRLSFLHVFFLETGCVEHRL